MFKNKLLFFAAVAILIELFLLIVGNNIPPRITKLSLVWMILLLVYNPRLYLSSSLLIFYLFVIFYVFLILYGIYTVPIQKFVYEEVFPIFLAISIFNHFRESEDKSILGLLCLISLVFLGITAIVTNIVYFKYPFASREMSSMGFDIRSFMYQRSHRLGTADYGFLSGVAFLVPSLVGLIKTGDFSKKIKIYFIILVSVIVLMLIRSTYSSFVLYSLIGLILASSGNRNMKKSMIFLAIGIIVFYFFPKHILSNWLEWFAMQFENSLIRDRLSDLSIALDKGLGMSHTHYSQRASRIPLLLDNFFQNPLVGKGYIITGHVFWFDRLAAFGLVGFIPLALLIGYQIKQLVNHQPPETLYFFSISFILFISYGLMKNYGSFKMYTVLFFIIPSLGYIKYAFPLENFFRKNKT